MGELHQNAAPLIGRVPMPTLAEAGVSKCAALEAAWQDGEAGGNRMIVFAQPLHETEWGMIRAFVRKTDRDDLHLRFGQSIDFHDDATLKRFFGISGAIGELLCTLDDAGDIVGVLHRVLVSPREAEIALIVRSDRKRNGIGERLLRTALSRAAQQGLKTLRALILRDNTPMLRLARKVGLTPLKSAGFAVEVEFVLG
jgi:GNAT superfamily N-acetyltransferase